MSRRPSRVAETMTLGVRHWWGLLARGIVAVLFGVVTLAWPGITALALLYVIAAWAIVTGVIEVVTAIRTRHQVRHAWLLGLAGAVSVAFGIALAITPGAGALVITWLIGWYAVILGVILIVMAFRVRGSGPGALAGDIAMA